MSKSRQKQYEDEICCQYVNENKKVCEQMNAKDCLCDTLACVDAPADMLRLESIYFTEGGWG